MKTLEQKLAELPADRRARIEADSDRMHAEYRKTVEIIEDEELVEWDTVTFL